MSSNEKAVTAHYRDTGEKHRATESRYAELEFYYTKKHISHYIGPLSSVIELGCGTGYWLLCHVLFCAVPNLRRRGPDARKHRAPQSKGGSPRA